MNGQIFTVHMSHDSGVAKITTFADCPDKARAIVCKAESAPLSAATAVYVSDPVPRLSGAYGAPMGRPGGNLDPESPRKHYRARLVQLDSGGYDKGGAYWGHRMGGNRLYWVQDGCGNVAFVDAKNSRDAIAQFVE